MTQNDQGWYLKVHNITVGWSRSLEVHYGASERFTQAEWFQEDPADGYAASKDVPYPSLSNVAFEHIEVNRRAPRIRYSDAEVLSTSNGVSLVPTHPHNDGFALLPASPVAVQFLTDYVSYEAAVAPANIAYYKDLLRPESAPLPSLTTMTRPMEALSQALASQSWPAADQRKVDAFIRDIEHNVRALKTWSLTSDRSWATLSSIVRNRTYLQDGNRLRLSLGLPPSYQ
jgi:hypothetical protein